ncbi:MAG: hypothetical protein ACK45H_05105, partial [Bacteroidota bacterium]
YLHCFISTCSGYDPDEHSTAADSTPQCIFIALFQFRIQKQTLSKSKPSLGEFFANIRLIDRQKQELS